MTNEQQEVTPEQYKQRLLKRNFANRCAEYEDAIASLQTQVALLQQQLEQAAEQTDVDLDGLELDAEADGELPPPPPPAE